MEIQAPQNFCKKRELDLKKILHFGAHISINPCGDEFNDHYMCSDGFVVKNILLKNFAVDQEDFASCVFRIIPAYSFDIQKKMIRTLQIYEESQGLHISF